MRTKNPYWIYYREEAARALKVFRMCHENNHVREGREDIESCTSRSERMGGAPRLRGKSSVTTNRRIVIF